jgi:hypothetical protein
MIMSRRIGVTVPEARAAVWDRFVEYVERKWGKKHTMVGLELMNILEEFLERAEGGKDPQKSRSVCVSNNKKRGIRSELPTIKEAILKYAEPGGSLHQDILEKIILSVTNVGNGKAVEDRIKVLIADRFIERMWDNGFKGKVFKVKGDLPREATC